MSCVPSKTKPQSAAALLGLDRPGRHLQLHICTALADLDPAEWDGLLDVDDAPLLSWGYLQGLEQAGCVGEAVGWQPAHLLIRIVDDLEGKQAASAGKLLAAAPAYVKSNSDGEWVYDFDWAEFAEQQGIAYYPKLVLAVPFNPVTGGRLLTRPDLPPAARQALRRVLLRAAQGFCQQAKLSSAHVLFPRGPRPAISEQAHETAPGPALPPESALLAETAAMTASGFLLRQQEQYHFLNAGYRSFDDFLGHLRSHRRSSIRRERRALTAAGISVRTHRGLGLAASGFDRADLDRVFDMYFATSQRYTGGPPFLNRPFFHLCAERLGDRLELVLARDRRGAIIGGAWNLRGDRRLFGRYWGRAELAEAAVRAAGGLSDPAGPGGEDNDQAGDQAGSHADQDGSEPGNGAGPPVRFLHFEVCYYQAIERCIEAGLEAFEPGHGGDQKLVRGFTPSHTYSAHYLRDARLRRPIEAFLQYEAPLVQKAMDEKSLRSGLREAYTGLRGNIRGQK